MKNEKKQPISNDIQNCYLDYFYSIYLKDITLDPNTGLPIFAYKSEQSTFLHEYIHFLQNVLTLNGIANTENELIYQQELLAKAAKTKRRFLDLHTLPINIKEEISNPYFKLRDIFYFDKDSEDEVTNFSTITDIKPKTENIMGYNETVYYLVVKEVRKNKLKKIKATENHIIEGMAYAAEKLVFPKDYTKLPDNPYNVINEITKFCYRPLYNNHRVQFALCELALSVSTSVDFYIQCLNKIKTNNLQTTNISILIKTLSSNLNAEFKMGNIVYRQPFMNAYIFRTKQLLKKYKNFFKLRIPDIYLWLDNLLLSCCLLKEPNAPITIDKIIPITTFINKLIQNPNLINSYIQTLGCPCIITETGFFNFPQRIFTNDIMYFSLYKNIIEYLARGNEREEYCAFYEFCKYKNRNCTRRTFKNIKKEPNCYYASLAKCFKIPFYLF